MSCKLQTCTFIISSGLYHQKIRFNFGLFHRTLFKTGKGLAHDKHFNRNLSKAYVLDCISKSPLLTRGLCMSIYKADNLSEFTFSPHIIYLLPATPSSWFSASTEVLPPLMPSYHACRWCGLRANEQPPGGRGLRAGLLTVDNWVCKHLWFIRWSPIPSLTSVSRQLQ